MNSILNPDIAFVVLGIALLTTIFALLAPGSGILEVLALIFLVAVGYAVANLPVNLWALFFLLVGIVTVIVAFRKTKKWYFIAGPLVLLIVGMVFLFWGVNPLLAGFGAVGIGAFIWVIGHNISVTFYQKPYSDLDRMVGMIGTANTDISHEGSVYVAGETWTARSEVHIPAGSSVRVLQRNGLVLKVELVEDNLNNQDL